MREEAYGIHIEHTLSTLNIRILIERQFYGNDDHVSV